MPLIIDGDRLASIVGKVVLMAFPLQENSTLRPETQHPSRKMALVVNPGPLWPKAVGSCGAYARPFAAHTRASQRSRRWCALPSSTAPPRQRVIAQAAIEPPAFLGHLGRQLGGGLGIEDLFEARSRQIREDEHPAGAPCRPTLVAHQVDRLAHGDDDQQLPKVVAVVELRELAAFGPLIEALEGTEGHILLVGRARGVPRRWARASPTSRWKYRSQSCWAAVRSPALSNWMQWVIDPSDAIAIVPRDEPEW